CARANWNPWQFEYW
nr:immunoglobulin heavy chain junction region [Macaca mulatta]